jgi:hypothetical protein
MNKAFYKKSVSFLKITAFIKNLHIFLKITVLIKVYSYLKDYSSDKSPQLFRKVFSEKVHHSLLKSIAFLKDHSFL